ncbi:MAG: alkaline phosphatase family protein [Lachnospiraceae bacterium]|jgi:predicted AlkP superfamily pyrophosphatase or phosphodiesterase
MKKLIVMSNDEMVEEDLAILRQMEPLEPLFQECAMVKHVRTVYPSVTYPCHVSIASGCYPDKTGVVSNEAVTPGNCSPKPWHWFHDSVKCKDIFDAAKAAGLSAQIYLKDPDDQDTVVKVRNVLDHLVERGVYGIERYYIREQAEQEELLKGDFSFVVETDGYTSFADDWREPLVHPMDLSDYRYGRATHGHNPSKGPQPPMLLWGPGVRRSAVLENCNIVDEAPTFAKILGIELPDADGRCLNELLVT